MVANFAKRRALILLISDFVDDSSASVCAVRCPSEKNIQDFAKRLHNRETDTRHPKETEDLSSARFHNAL